MVDESHKYEQSGTVKKRWQSFTDFLLFLGELFRETMIKLMLPINNKSYLTLLKRLYFAYCVLKKIGTSPSLNATLCSVKILTSKQFYIFFLLKQYYCKSICVCVCIYVQ